MAENCENDRRIRREAAVDRQARMLEVCKHDYLQLDPSFITFIHVFQGFRYRGGVRRNEDIDWQKLCHGRLEEKIGMAKVKLREVEEK